MTLLVQISDTHFGTERPAVVEALVRCVRDQAPDVVVLSGDITQRARRGQFRSARAFIDRLGAPAVVVPGNHDIPLFNAWARVFSPHANYCDEFGRDLEPVFTSPDMLIVGVNTTRWYRHVDGEISAAQVERVADRLSRATRSQLRLVVTHQPLAVVRQEDEGNLLRGGDAAVRRWLPAGVDLILGGHIHLPFVAEVHEQVAGLPRSAWVVQAGTAVSRRIREEAGNSINIIRYAGLEGTRRRACVERWDYADALGSFARVASQELSFEAGAAGEDAAAPADC